MYNIAIIMRLEDIGEEYMTYKIKLFLSIIILFIILYSSEIHDIYMYYTSPEKCDKYVLYYNCFINKNGSIKKQNNAKVILYSSNSRQTCIDCEGEDTACNVLDKIYERVLLVTYNFTGGYRFDGSPSFLLFLYRGNNESYNYVLDTFGDKILVYASITSNTSSYTFYLIKLEAPYRCFELNIPFYLLMFLIKIFLSILIIGAIFMAYKTWFKG